MGKYRLTWRSLIRRYPKGTRPRSRDARIGEDMHSPDATRWRGPLMTMHRCWQCNARVLYASSEVCPECGAMLGDPNRGPHRDPN